jgi:hypothetical protein
MAPSRPLSLLVLAAFGAAGCRVWKTTSSQRVPSHLSQSDPRIASSRTHLDTDVTPTGEIAVRVTMVPTCEAESYTVTEYRDHQQRRSSWWISGVIVGSFSAVGGVPTTILGHDGTRTFGVLLGIGGVVLDVVSVRHLIKEKGFRTVTRTERSRGAWAAVPCSDDLVRKAQDRAPGALHLTTPWGASLSARVRGGVATFRVAWKASGVDPMAADATLELGGVWSVAADGVGSTRVTFSDQAIQTMVQAVGRATGTVIAVGKAGEPPLLSLERFAIYGPDGKVTETVRAGDRVRFELTLRNDGRGDAYQVIARTKSSEDAFHGLQLSFGRIGAGQHSVRDVTVLVPRDHGDGEALLALSFTEAHNNAPNDWTGEFKIVAAHRPRLELACKPIRGVKLSRPDHPVVDAGAVVVVHCTLANRGEAPARAAGLTARLASEPAKSTETRDIPPGGAEAFDVLVHAPGDGELDDPLRLVVDAHETNFQETAEDTSTLYVGRPQICTKMLTKAEFDERVKELEHELKDDPDLLKRYKFDLLKCRKVAAP